MAVLSISSKQSLKECILYMLSPQVLMDTGTGPSSGMHQALGMLKSTYLPFNTKMAFQVQSAINVALF